MFLNEYPLMKPLKKKLLIIGHPRCGSGFASQICKDVGLDIAHERMGGDGISSWMFAVDSWNYPFGIEYASNNKYVKFDRIVQHIRNPFEALPSIIVENRVSKSFAFRDRHIRRYLGISMNDYDSEVNKAALSFLGWHLMCQEKKPEMIFRVEDQAEYFSEYLYENFILETKSGELTKKPVNTAESHFSRGIRSLNDSHLSKVDLKIFIKPELNENSWNLIDRTLLNKMIEFCNVYGYEVPDIIKKIV